ncbi:MAG: hypothetical protein K2J87_02075, partial [Muribaculaceae bacterium]|nr:hypothetical protein [Muribaculaceae bacterium]
MKAKYLALGAILLGALGLSSCKSEGNKDKADTVAVVDADAEYAEAPVLTERQLATSDSVFKALKGKEKLITDTTVYTTPSGLRYMVLKKGEGKKP